MYLRIWYVLENKSDYSKIDIIYMSVYIAQKYDWLLLKLLV